MPELAEVEYFRKRWDSGCGQAITSIKLHEEKRIFRGLPVKQLSRALTGATLLGSEARGKQILFQFTGDVWLGLHLGMTGKLSSEPASFKPSKHDHLVLYQKERALVFNDMRLFGRVLFHQGADVPDWWSRLPPPLTGEHFTAASLRRILAKRGNTPIKSLLLSQEYFPGIGNWMADEILWQARIHPEIRAKTIGGEKRTSLKLWRSIRSVCAEALEKVGRDFSDPPPSWLFHERWKKKGRCPRHREELVRKVVGGRTTAFCPRCQIKERQKTEGRSDKK